MNQSVSRRQFLQAAMAAGAAVSGSSLLARSQCLAADAVRSPNEKLNLVVVGITGQGGYNLSNVSSENIIGLCDISDENLEKVGAKYPNAKRFFDYREALELPNIDGVVCSTPDHMHAFVVAPALKKKIPVYCEKPLTHSVWEARQLRKLNAAAGVPTQMGNQIHALENYRRVVEIIRAGTIGPVDRVHVWQNGGGKSFTDVKTSEPPAGIHYDQWIGPAPYRPYSPAHFQFNWRYWWDFGGGQLGDFGCHYMDLPFWALQLGAPLTVAAIGEKARDAENDCPTKLKVDYKFPARGDMPAVHLTWYHGGEMPPGAEEYKKGAAVLFEGPKGRVLSDYTTNQVFLQDGKTAAPVKPWIANSVAGHHAEWLTAIKTNGTTSSHFEYAGTLTEAVLLGNVSYRAGRPIKWDAAALQTDSPEADKFLKRDYRSGWSL